MKTVEKMRCGNKTRRNRYWMNEDWKKCRLESERRIGTYV
jgi:hypothetical protein